MSHGMALITKLEDKGTPINSQNLILIKTELDYIQKDINKLKKSLNEVCKLIHLIGIYLIKGESLNTTEGLQVFDTFCGLNIMTDLLKLSSYDNYKINLQIIQTFSFILINIKKEISLYYLFSNNLLNKIISKDYSKYDEEFLSHFVNFLKSLSLRLDETSIQLFYIEKTNSFPLIENVLKIYNHRDAMIRNVVRNIVLNILKIKSEKIQNHFIKLPSISYLANIACHLRDVCLKMNDKIFEKNATNINYLFDDLIEETIYIDDILNLNLPKINYVVMNCIFYYLILPIICGSISEKTNRISKNLSIFLLIFFFLNIKNLCFKNCLFTLLFFDNINNDIESLLTIPPDKKNYSYKMEDKKDISFNQFISENYSTEFLLTIIQEDNIIYTKYNKKYPQLSQILQKCRGIAKNLLSLDNKMNFTEVKDKLETVINCYFTEEQSNSMGEYHRNLCMSTGVGVGQFCQESTAEIFNLCFMCYINQIFNNLKGVQSEENSYQSSTKNVIKEGLMKLIDDKNSNENNETNILLNMLIFVIMNREVNISNNLLKYCKLENLKEKKERKESFIDSVFNFFGTKAKKDSPLSELYFSNNNFNYNNQFFDSIKSLEKNENTNIKNFPEALIKLFSINYNDKNSENKDDKNNINISTVKNNLLLPITYQINYLNVLNLSVNSNNSLMIKFINTNNKNLSNENILNAINKQLKLVLQIINVLLKNNGKFREEGYNLFYQQWRNYNKNITNDKIFELVKETIMISGFILLPDEFEKLKDEDHPKILSLNDSYNSEENIFKNCLLIFMQLNDLKDIFSNIRNRKLTLIKDNFPLSDSKNDFSVDKEYNIEKISPKKIYRQVISYKAMGSEISEKGELIVFRDFLYFCSIIKRFLIRINLKFQLDAITMYNNKDENNVINFFVPNDKNVENGEDEENQGDENNNNKNNLDIVVKLKDEKTRDEVAKFLNEKIANKSNNDRLVFNQYFDDNYNKYNGESEDF